MAGTTDRPALTVDRRWGVLVLVLAAVALLAVTRLGGRDVPGRAVGLPLEPVPVPSACLLHTTDFDAAEVPCTEVHTAEVVRSWTAQQLPAVGGGQFRLLCPTGVEFDAPARSSGDWFEVSPPIATTLLRGGGPVLGWVACVRTPVFQQILVRPLQYVGRLASGPDATRTARIGFCLDDADEQIDCSRPHRTERLGQFWPTRRTTDPSTACATYAGRRIGSATPLSGDAALTVHVAALANGGTTRVEIQMGNGTESLPTRTVPLDGCDVRAPAGRSLTGSVLGIGSGPVPFG